MIFGLGRKGGKDAKAEAGKPGEPETAGDESKGAGRVPAGLAPEDLRRTADVSALDFRTTDDLEPMHALIGQERAIRALNFGAGMQSSDFNIFVLGTDASGKAAAVRSMLKALAKEAPIPDDWVYVNNFEDPNKPNALRLKAGRGRKLHKAMVALIDELRAVLPTAFEGEDYQARSRAIDAEYGGRTEERLQELGRKAEDRGIALLRTPLGFTFAPMLEGKVVKPEAFGAMPPSMQAEVREAIEALQEELRQILEDVPRSEKERRHHLRALNEEVAASAVRESLREVIDEFGEDEGALEYLRDLERDLIANAQLFLGEASREQGDFVPQPLDSSRDPRFRRYMVNAMVTREADLAGAPVEEEANPTHGNIIGRTEHLAHMGALVTDFLLIKPGALHKANGGYLLIDARKLLSSPFAWEALKRCLSKKSIRIEQPTEALGIISTQTLDPEPIPISVKVVLFGDRQLYYLLLAADPEFQQLFKVQADFDDTIERTAENTVAYSRLVAAIVSEYGLRPLEVDAVAGVIEQGSRMAGDRDKLSIEVSRIGDLVREADYWAGHSERSVTTRDDVRRAIHEHIQRADRLRDRDQETFERGIVLVDTVGRKIGQINGLSVLQLGDFSFGRPNRITARVRFGPGRVVDIEREAKLGGPLHSKGVMILWGYLAGLFARERPLALSASLVFEQSYGGVEGDSASSTELYALLSALSEVPVKQGIAVTGSVNQLGDVQAIGGVNEKIEGFYDVCNARGLTGEQGVIIPRSNVQHLMLREDMVEAVRNGKFAVWAVSTIAEGIEILTGMPAGMRGEDGLFPTDSVYGRVEERLKVFAERAKAAGDMGISGGETKLGDGV
jgi:lon-related putative ATP-dependent protease